MIGLIKPITRISSRLNNRQDARNHKRHAATEEDRRTLESVSRLKVTTFNNRDNRSQSGNRTTGQEVLDQSGAGSGCESSGKRISTCIQHNLEERNQNRNAGCVGLRHEGGQEGHAEEDEDRRDREDRANGVTHRVDQTDCTNDSAHEQEADRCNQRGSDQTNTLEHVSFRLFGIAVSQNHREQGGNQANQEHGQAGADRA